MTYAACELKIYGAEEIETLEKKATRLRGLVGKGRKNP